MTTRFAIHLLLNQKDRADVHPTEVVPRAAAHSRLDHLSHRIAALARELAAGKDSIWIVAIAAIATLIGIGLWLRRLRREHW